MDTTTPPGWQLYLAPVGIIERDTSGRVVDANLLARLLSDDAQVDTLPHWLTAILGEDLSDPGGSQLAGDCTVARSVMAASPWGALWLRLFRPFANDGAATDTLYLQLEAVEEAERLWRRFALDCTRATIWRAYASAYDHVLLSLDYYRTCVDRHVRQLTAITGGHILDIGGGTGSVAIPLAAAGKQVTVVDPGRAMLDKLRSKLSPVTAPRVCIIERSAESIHSYADASFDGVNILLSLFDMGQPMRAFAEAIRVLKPGGTMVVTEPHRTFSLATLLRHAEADLRARADWPALEADWERVCNANQQIDPQTRTGERVWAEVARDLLSDANFAQVAVTPSHYDQCATVTGVKPAA